MPSAKKEYAIRLNSKKRFVGRGAKPRDVDFRDSVDRFPFLGGKPAFKVSPALSQIRQIRRPFANLAS
jgi:hypothetical protein